MIGLELLSPDLVAKLRLASPDKQRAAALVSCEFAISHARVEHPLVEEALRELHVGTVLIPQRKAKIDALASQIDEEYFDLQEAAQEGRASKEEYLQMFAKARAVAALSFACTEDAFQAATEAIYEAAATIGDTNKRELFALVESALK